MRRYIRADEIEGGIVRLAIDNPSMRNALTSNLREDLIEALDTAAGDHSIYGVILYGAGGHFCSGGDISTMGNLTPDSARERMEAVKASALAVAGFSKPVISVVSGHAAGAGIGLALLTDAVVASADAVFNFSFRRLALGPDWGLSHTLVSRVGPVAAKRLLMEGAVVRAADAFQLGLVDYVAADIEAGLAKACNLMSRLVVEPRQRQCPIKLQFADLDRLANALDAEAELQVQRFLSKEHRDAVQKFMSSKEKARIHAR